MKKIVALLIIAAGFLATAPEARAQGEVKWLAVGSMHNWYSEYGCEIEHGNQAVQQYGLRWPAWYDYQDMQAAKGMWIGVRDHTDNTGKFWPHRVVHVGPRVNGSGEIWPMKFEMYTKFAMPEVTVDDAASNSVITSPDNMILDPNLKSDRMILNEFNTLIGATVTRKIYAFSSPFHDNYHIAEYVIKNTGRVDKSTTQAINDTLRGLYLYFQYRYSICREVRYLVNNSAGWGINTMNDTRGVAGIDPPVFDPASGAYEQIRAQFAWHGRHPSANTPPADNVGAPIWQPSYSAGYIGAADTVGRLGAAQFVGNSTLFASKSPQEAAVDDTTQPKTTAAVGSDEPETSGNSAFNQGKMTKEYTEWMSIGHKTPRQAWATEPSGFPGFIAPTGDPALGTPGGWSSANGYGPYDLAPGDSVIVVIAEGADGLTREEAISVGMRYKNLKTPAITAVQKNDSVIRTGHTRILEMFRKARQNYKTGFGIIEPPQPPASFKVNGLGDRIHIEWTASPSAGVTGYNLYRARGRRDSTYYLLRQAGLSETSFDDTSAFRGDQYFYYITAVGAVVPPNSPTREPAGVALESNRAFTQTYDPAFLKRPAGTSMGNIRIAPNPYVLKADQNKLRFPGEPDKIAFFNIPGRCRIRIFTEIGEFIWEKTHTDGSGDDYWNSVTSSGQVVVSGLYIVVFDNLDTGERAIQKLVVIR